MTTQEIYDVIEAAIAGKAIEKGTPIGRPVWTDYDPAVDDWDFKQYLYRVKTDPREIYIPATRMRGLPRSIEACRAAYPGEEPIIRFVETPLPTPIP